MRVLDGRRQVEALRRQEGVGGDINVVRAVAEVLARPDDRLDAGELTASNT